MHLNAPSALKVGGRFENTTPVTLSAFEAIFFDFLPDSQFLSNRGKLPTSGSLPLIIRQDKNPPEENCDKGWIGCRPREHQHDEIAG